MTKRERWGKVAFYEKESYTQKKDTRSFAPTSSYESLRRFEEFVQLRDYGVGTRREYPRYVRTFSRHFDTDPAALGELEARDFLLHLRVQCEASRSTMSGARAALRCFFDAHLGVGKDWGLWRELRVRGEHKVPVVLTRQEVEQLLGAVHHARPRMIMHLMYHTGLRIGEACHLQVGDIDGKGLTLRVRHSRDHHTKNRAERLVPITQAMLEDLRHFWSRHRHPKWLFPALPKGWRSRGLSVVQAAAEANAPLKEELIQKVMRLALQQCAITKAATPHSFRHSFATHMLEEGVDVRLIGMLLGHAKLESTLVYLHLTEINSARAREAQLRLDNSRSFINKQG
jgi:integrase/recombinase XerD